MVYKCSNTCNRSIYKHDDHRQSPEEGRMCSIQVGIKAHRLVRLQRGYAYLAKGCDYFVLRDKGLCRSGMHEAQGLLRRPFLHKLQMGPVFSEKLDC